MSVSWEELKQAIKEVLKEEAQSQPQESHVEHVCECPDCLCGVMEKLNRTSDYMCSRCHFPLGTKEFAEKLKACPNCGETQAEKVLR